MGCEASIKMFRSIVQNLGWLTNGIRFLKERSKGERSYEGELKKKNLPCANLRMLVVLKEYQGQGYMCEQMEILRNRGCAEPVHRF